MAEYSCLIVEDSPMMRQLLVFALARVKNLRVTEADDGVDGLRKLASARYDIIVTDINMPIMDGWAFLEEYNKFYSRLPKAIQIYMVSSSVNSSDMQKSRSYKAVNDYLVKPVNRSKYQELMEGL